MAISSVIRITATQRREVHFDATEGRRTASDERATNGDHLRSEHASATCKWEVKLYKQRYYTAVPRFRSARLHNLAASNHCPTRRPFHRVPHNLIYLVIYTDMRIVARSRIITIVTSAASPANVYTSTLSWNGNGTCSC